MTDVGHFLAPAALRLWKFYVYSRTIPYLVELLLVQRWGQGPPRRRQATHRDANLALVWSRQGIRCIPKKAFWLTLGARMKHGTELMDGWMDGWLSQPNQPRLLGGIYRLKETQQQSSKFSQKTARWDATTARRLQ